MRSSLSYEQLERLCEIAEEAARRYVTSRIPNRGISDLSITVNSVDSETLNLEIDVEITLSPLFRKVNVKKLAEEAVNAAFEAAKKYLRGIYLSFQKIKSLIREVAPRSILLLCHQNADPDALCSAFVLSELLKRICPKVEIEIASPEGISKLSEALSDFLPVKVTTDHPNFAADIIVMLDTNTTKQLGSWEKNVRMSTAPLIVIDHHASHPETERLASVIICDEEASSTCEIIYRFFEESNIKPSKEEAQALFLGIAFDTKHFVLAKSSTFKVAAALVDSGVNAQEILSRLSLPTSLSERIARLKACRRMQLIRINNWLIVFSRVSSFQASAARSLVGMGAHLAMVGGQRGDNLQISIRSDPEFYKETGFHLGRDLAKPLGEYFHGMGGGHSTAAGVNGTGDYEAAVKRAIRIIREKLKKTSFKN